MEKYMEQDVLLDRVIMSVNFVLGDFLARLNNAKKQHLISIYVQNTRLVKDILLVLVNLGVIRDITLIDDKYIEVFLKYYKRRCVYKSFKLVSLPSKRVYLDLIKLIKLKNTKSGYIYILSTTKGIKTDFECIYAKISGEILFRIEI